MHKGVRAAKLCCLGEFTLKRITMGRSTQKTVVFQIYHGFMFFGNIGCFWNIEGYLLNMRSIKNERFGIFIALGKSTPMVIKLNQEVQTLIFLNSGSLGPSSFRSLTFLIHDIWRSNCTKQSPICCQMAI